jgi:glycerol-3-phosphate dehydrogenase
VLKLLGFSRKISTANLPLGGGKGFPTAPEMQLAWAENNHLGVGKDRALQLLLRYGTRATEILRLVAAKGEKRLKSHEGFTDTEIEYLITHEQVCKVEDIVQRRTNLAFTGEASPELVQELEAINARTGVSVGSQFDDSVPRSKIKAGGR